MSFYGFIDTLTLLAPALLLLGIAAGAYYFKSLDRAHKTITIYLLVALIADLMSRGYVVIYENNLVFILLFSLLELILFSSLYFTLFLRKRNPFLIGLTAAGTLFIIWELFSLKFASVEQFQSYSKVVDTFLIVLLSVSFFFEKIRDKNSQVWEFFQLNSIILLFFSLNLLFFLPINFLINETSNLKFYFWLGNLAVTLIFYLLLTREIWKNGMTRKQLRSG